MEFQDRILRCVDCGAEFVWTAGEQQFFADKNFKNEPKRCKACKGKRASRPAGGRGAASGWKPSRTCSACGKETTVPFQADAGAPGLLQGMLPVPEIRRGWRRLASSSIDSALFARYGSPRSAIVPPRAPCVARCVKLTRAYHLERFHADRGTDRWRRRRARPEGQDHAGRGRRAAQGQGQQPRQPGSQERSC